MSEFTKFIVCKKAKKNKITACEFENLKGLSVSPKKDFKLDGMINVSKVTLYNPVLIKNYVSKKCKRNMDRILKLLKLLFDSDNTDPSSFMLALNEIEKFRQLIMFKYKEYMDKKEYNILIKKLEILEQEVKNKMNYVYQEEFYLEEKKGKKGR